MTRVRCLACGHTIAPEDESRTQHNPRLTKACEPYGEGEIRCAGKHVWHRIVRPGDEHLRTPPEAVTA